MLPRLQREEAKASKRTLRGADCKIGKVTKRKGASGKTGHVVTQGKKPGTVLPAGSVVKVTLGQRVEGT
jgi:beta-lactam-binding protein with PASTA domain